MVTKFGEVDVLPVAEDWRPEGWAPGTYPVMRLPAGQGITAGPEPGYSVHCDDAPIELYIYPSGDDRDLLVFIAPEPITVAHVFYGETIMPAGSWRLFLRTLPVAPCSAELAVVDAVVSVCFASGAGAEGVGRQLASSFSVSEGQELVNFLIGLKYVSRHLVH